MQSVFCNHTIKEFQSDVKICLRIFVSYFLCSLNQRVLCFHLVHVLKLDVNVSIVIDLAVAQMQNFEQFSVYFIS